MAREFVERIHINSPPERVWAVLADVERWPEWTESMKKVDLLDGGPLATGSRARLRIRGSLATPAWTVTSFEPTRSFTWSARIMPGVTSHADHELTPAEGGTDVTLRVRMEGPLAGIAAVMLARVSRENMRMEAEGLKRASEA